ncbi:MAG: hypothetical protein EOQ42_01440 [Mesorhizobium sp.]|nr:MAG: hypothetical protein EOQ42_01440 [Mesorhizobium sp.]TIU78664.1 MAG: hypothetical protein E5W13_10320 [Mesorhizobium sp.]
MAKDKAPDADGKGTGAMINAKMLQCKQNRRKQLNRFSLIYRVKHCGVRPDDASQSRSGLSGNSHEKCPARGAGHFM